MNVNIEEGSTKANFKFGDVFCYRSKYYILAKSVDNDKFGVTLSSLNGDVEWNNWFDLNEFVTDKDIDEFEHYSQNDYEIVLKRK